MDTSGESVPSIILFLALLSLWVNVAIRMLPLSTLRRRTPVVAIVFAVLIGVPSLLQFAFPVITQTLERQPPHTVDDGQWWRIVTAVAAQDGGMAGAIFNLVVLVGVLAVGEWVWGRWRTVTLFLVPSIILNLLAIGWDQWGGGSSFASDGLLASMCGFAEVAPAPIVAKVCAALAIAVGIVLVALNDAHGVAVLLGAVLGVIFGTFRRDTVRGRTRVRPSV